MKSSNQNNEMEKMKAWNIYLNEKRIDTVFYNNEVTAEEVKRGLIEHDGFDSGIIIRCEVKFSGLPVDAGHILIADADFYKNWFPKKSNAWKSPVTTVEKGLYECRWDCPLSLRRKGKARLKVTSGKVYVGDSCYLVGDHVWMKFLESTANKNGEYFRRLPRGVIFINTGGDGCFKLKLELEKIGEIT